MIHLAYYFAAILIGILFLVLAGYAARHASIPGAKILPMIMFLAASYPIAYILQMSSPNLDSAIFWYNVSLPGANLLAPIWCIFVLMWTGHLEKPDWRVFLPLSIVPVLVCLAAWTNPLHQMYGSNFRFTPQFPWAVLEWDSGLWYWVGFIYAYALFAGTIAILLHAAVWRLHLSLSQALLLLSGVLAPVVFNVLFRLGITPVEGMDISPFTFIFTGITWSLAFFRYGILDVIPVAHERVFASLPLGMIVLDARGRVADINPAARRMLASAEEVVIGAELPASLPAIFTGAGDSVQGQEIQETIRLDMENAPSYLDVRLSLIIGADNQRKGVLIMLDDITERKTAQDALRASEDKMRALFAAMNDVIIIYDIQAGYLERAPTRLDTYKPLPELLGKTFEQVFPADLAAVFDQATRQALAQGQVTGLEYCMLIEQKETWFSANVSALSDRTVLWVARDITAQKQFE